MSGTEAIAGLALAFTLAFAPAAHAAAGDLDLVSRANGAAGASGNGGSQLPVTSKDGHLVAFSSSATNLTADTVPAGVRQAYVRNLTAGTTILASAAANASVSDVGMSDDGRYVVFGTRATNLGPATGGIDRVFLRDTVANTTTLVLDNAVRPAISADGSTIALCSTANLAGGTGASLKVYAYDIASRTFELVSRGNGAGTAMTGDNPSVSDDGTTIAFSGQGGGSQIWVRDRAAQTTTLASRASGTDGAQASSAAIEPDLSGNGRYVVFRTSATNLSDDDVDTSDDIFERDLVASTTTLVSRADGATGAGASGDSDLPQVSDDGTRVFFRSRSANLSAEDNDNGDNGFVRDTVTGTTTLVHGRIGQSPPPQGVMDGLALSGDGRYAVYASNATLLPAEETGSFSDVFRRDLGAPPPPPPPPSASLGDDQTTPEGGLGSHALTFAVTLSAADARAVAVDWRTAGGTATAGEDYRAASGQLTFAPGQTTAFISVDVLGDDTYEADETFSIELSNPQNAKLGRARAQVTIANDDLYTPPPPPPPPPGAGGLPRTSGPPAASCATKLVKGDAVMRGCFNADGKATGRVSLNGLTVDLLGGTLTATDKEVSASGPVAISAGDLVVHRGALKFNPDAGPILVPPSGTGLYGLTFGPRLVALLDKDGSAKLNGQATLPFGAPLPLTFTTADADGLRRDSLVVGGDATIVGAITLASLKFTFDPAAAVWRGGLTLPLWKATRVTGTIDQRGVTSLTGQLPGMGVLKLRTATATIVPRPFSVKGDLAYDFGPGPLFTFDGTYAFTPGQPFALTGSAKLFGIQLGKLGDIFRAAFGGAAGNVLGSMVAKTDLALGHPQNATPPAPPPATMKSILDSVGGVLAGLNLALDLNTGHFSGGGDGSFTVLGVTVAGSLTFNQNGFAACGQIGPIQAGFGVRVNPFSLQLMGPFVCDVGPWKATAAQASGVIKVPEGVHLVRLHGTATLHGPGGQTVSTAASQVSPTLAVLHDGDVTYVAVKGAWTVEGATGVDIASQLPPVKVTARVVKSTVRYTERVSPGQKVVLAEDSGRELGTLHGAKGTLRFKPGAGRHDIVALVTQDGLPMSRKVVAHYTAPKPPKPTKVTVRAKGAKLTVTWHGGAATVVAKTPNGTLVAQSRGHRATLTDIAPVKKATVTLMPSGVSARLRR